MLKPVFKLEQYKTDYNVSSVSCNLTLFYSVVLIKLAFSNGRNLQMDLDLSEESKLLHMAKCSSSSKGLAPAEKAKLELCCAGSPADGIVSLQGSSEITINTNVTTQV